MDGGAGGAGYDASVYHLPSANACRDVVLTLHCLHMDVEKKRKNRSLWGFRSKMSHYGDAALSVFPLYSSLY